MPIISDRDQETIKRLFENRLSGPVEIVMFTEQPSLIFVPGREDCATCNDTEEILKEVSGLSEKITLTVHEISRSKELAAEHGIDRIPAFVLKGASRGRVRFFGIPSGHEFSAFIADIVDSSTGISGLSDETREYLAGLSEDVNIKVFTTPT